MHRGYDYYVEKPKEPTKMFLELIHEFSKFEGCKVNIKNLYCFYILIIKYQKGK